MTHQAGRRRLIKGLVATAAVGMAGWCAGASRWHSACQGTLSESLRDDPQLKGLWSGLDPQAVWDCHAHLAGTGDAGSGIEIGPAMQSPLKPVQYLSRIAYQRASCAREAGQTIDEGFVTRLRELVMAMPEGFKVLLFAFDRAFDDGGHPLPAQSAFHVPDRWAMQQAAAFPQGFKWVASVHPYRADACDALEEARANGACAVKWLPAAQGMDPALARNDAYYRTLAALQLPLIVHCGDERAVKGTHTPQLGNPLRLRRALDAGVRVVVAHCASMGMDQDLDRSSSGAAVSSFSLFARLMDEPRASKRLYGDLSAIVLRDRKPEILQTLLGRRDWQDRLLNGSDYPLPAILPLIAPSRWVRAGLLPAESLHMLEALQVQHPLLFDFALKRLMRWQGQRFDAAVFETRRVFDLHWKSRE